MRTRGGFSLVEVLIALVVFEVGFLGVLAMTLQAQKTLLAAVELESAAQAVEWLADSLSFTGWGGSGSIETERGLIRWTREASGLVTVIYQGGPGTSGSVGLSLEQPDAPEGR